MNLGGPVHCLQESVIGSVSRVGQIQSTFSHHFFKNSLKITLLIRWLGYHYPSLFIFLQ